MAAWKTSAIIACLVGISAFLWNVREKALTATLVPAKTVTYPYTPGGFQRGMAVMFYSDDYLDLAELDWKWDLILERLVDAHVNIVSLNWPIYTEGLRSNKVFRGEGTPSDEAIRFSIRKVSERGFAVALRPILDEKIIVATGRRGEWRGTIRPKSVGEWFENYTELMRQYATIAAEEGAEILIIGTELQSMERYADRWRTMISRLREFFPGELSYSSNRGISKEMPWDALDFISVDAFFQLKTAREATEDEMVRAWQRWVPELEGQAKKIGKPLVFTELGSASQRGAHRKTWVWNHKTGLDLEDQRRFYAASCAVWRDRLRGIFWWTANVWLPEHSLEDTSFTPLGKPAEAEIRTCYG